MNRKIFAGALAAAVAAGLQISANAAQDLVFIGSGRANIEAYHFDVDSGALTRIGVAAEIAHPSFFAIAPNHHFLYAITEGHGTDDSSVSAFSIDAAAGKLTLLNTQPAVGAGPCYVEVDASGKNALIANYGSGSVAVYPLSPTGSLNPMSAFIQDQGSSVDSSRQEGPHAHCIVTDPTDRFAMVCDLGLDKVLVFKFEPGAGTLQASDTPFVATKPGAGPRHIAFHPGGKWAYVITEMGCSINAYSYKAESGTFQEIQSESTLPKDFPGKNTDAEVAAHPSGKFVYCSNRGDDSIAVFRCNPRTGRLKFVERASTLGKTPRQFEIDPTGAWLLAGNQDTDSVVVFRIDKATGRLQPVGDGVHTDNPMCIKFLPMN